MNVVNCCQKFRRASARLFYSGKNKSSNPFKISLKDCLFLIIETTKMTINKASIIINPIMV